MTPKLRAINITHYERRSSAAAIVQYALERFSDLPGFGLLQGCWMPGDLSTRGVLIFLEPVCSCTTPELLDQIIAQQFGGRSVPFACGFVSYEYLHQIETSLPVRHAENLPRFLFRFYSRVLLVPQESKHAATCFEMQYDDAAPPAWSAGELTPILQACESAEAQHIAPLLDAEALQARLADYANFTAQEYSQAVSRVRELIYQGAVYQVNLTQRFTLPYDEKPHAIWQKLAAFTAPAFGAFLNAAPDGVIASAAPELFLDRCGAKLCAAPIKGTRARSLEPRLDRLLAEELQSSAKDRAELSMIVDLIRNDLGRVAEIGSVTVTQHARLESLSYVHQLVTDITARLQKDKTFAQILAALFPCGSITGAPKIAAMRQITELERCARGVYTGSIGYLQSNGDFRLNVAIRTAVLQAKQLSFSAGGGVVWESEPLAEYRESLAKAAGLVTALK